jgi:hypothetical protein
LANVFAFIGLESYSTQHLNCFVVPTSLGTSLAWWVGKSGAGQTPRISTDMSASHPETKTPFLEVQEWITGYWKLDRPSPAKHPSEGNLNRPDFRYVIPLKYAANASFPSQLLFRFEYEPLLSSPAYCLDGAQKIHILIQPGLLLKLSIRCSLAPGPVAFGRGTRPAEARAILGECTYSISR